MDNKQNLVRVLIFIWASSLVPFTVISVINHYFFGKVVINSELIFLFIGPSVYMHYYKKKYMHSFSLVFSRRVANYFTFSFLILYMIAVGLYTLSLDQASLHKLADSIYLVIISLLVVLFMIYSFGRIWLIYVLSDEFGEAEINYLKYVAVLVAFSAIAALGFMMASTISNNTYQFVPQDSNPGAAIVNRDN